MRKFRRFEGRFLVTLRYCLAWRSGPLGDPLVHGPWRQSCYGRWVFNQDELVELWS